MNGLRRVLGIGVGWGIVWLACWAIVITVIGIFDPDSIDPGEGPMVMLTILGPMGFLSGVAVGTLLTIGARGRTAVHPSVVRSGWQGFLGTAIVQMAYLGHGDAGLLANLRMALLFSVIGSVVTVACLFLARTWSRRRLGGLSP
jgi:hypothetical protein